MKYWVTVTAPVRAMVEADSEAEAIKEGERAFKNMKLCWYDGGNILEITAVKI